jgi:hypothetical protein
MVPREDPQFSYLPIWLISRGELDRWAELHWLEQLASRLLVPLQQVPFAARPAPVM